VAGDAPGLQSKPVKVVFTAYASTLEEQAMALMGQKMRAAQLLYGDEVGGAIVPEEDGNFLTQLARTVLQSRELPDLKTLFAAARQETDSPLGSPTAQSPRLPVYTEEQCCRHHLQRRFADATNATQTSPQGETELSPWRGRRLSPLRERRETDNG
jgi:hypothetical protein